VLVVPIPEIKELLMWTPVHHVLPVLTQLSMVLRVVLIALLVVLVNGPPRLVLQIPPSASLVRGELIRRKQ